MDTFPSFPPQRIVPSNVGAEQSLLGAIMHGVFDPFALDLESWHFCDLVHGHIFGALQRLISLERPYDAVALAAELKPTRALDEVGGSAYLGELVRDPCPARSARNYARAIKDSWLKRKLIGIAESILSDAFGETGTEDTPPPDGDQLLELARHRIAMLAIEAKQ